MYAMFRKEQPNSFSIRISTSTCEWVDDPRTNLAIRRILDFGIQIEVVILTGLKENTTKSHVNGRVLFHKAPTKNDSM